MVGVTRTGQRSYDYQATGGQQVDPVAHQMAKPALHLVAHDRTAHGFAHDETRTCPGSALPRRVRVRGTASKVDDEGRAAGPRPAVAKSSRRLSRFSVGSTMS
jgi:hypothetical protein